MAVKEWVAKFQPVQLYIVLTLTVVFFITELVVSHLTHALTLLMDSYHMLCNILALSGCIITIKHCSQVVKPNDEMKDAESTDNIKEEECCSKPSDQDNKVKKHNPNRTKQENKLKNTFGWTRIDVITMLICCVFLGSFSFSIYVEAFQTLAHIDHQDEMHHPLFVLCIGAAGLILNGICYLLIGGYTFHQGSFLYVTESGDVVLNKVVVNDSVRKGARRLSRTRHIFSSPPKKRQGLWEATRDIIGCAVVMTCSVIILFTDPYVAKFVDPILSVVSATCIMILSYPYIKESCLILLQTMPDTIDIETMKKELTNHFPDIINVHDFHIWQLTASKIISTIHIIFEDPKVYRNIMEEIKEFFAENGVTQVTIQPEFFRQSASLEKLNTKLPPVCLVACQGETCKLNHCCPSYEDLNMFKSSSKEMFIYSERSTPTLKAVRIIDDELHSYQGSTYSINTIGTSGGLKIESVLEKPDIQEEVEEEIRNSNEKDSKTDNSQSDETLEESTIETNKSLTKNSDTKNTDHCDSVNKTECPEINSCNLNQQNISCSNEHDKIDVQTKEENTINAVTDENRSTNSTEEK